MTCTCGSGGHPRHCEEHPEYLNEHCADMNRCSDEGIPIVFYPAGTLWHERFPQYEEWEP